MFSDALEWPETDIGQTVSLSCPCGDLSLGVGHPSAQRQCSGSFTSGAQWSSASDTACNFTRSTEELCQVPAEVRKTIAACISILKYGLLFQLLPLSEAVSSVSDLSATELNIIITTLEQTVNQSVANMTVSTHLS